MSSLAFEQLLDEMHTKLAAEGVRITREQLRVKLAAIAWHAVIFD